MPNVVISPFVLKGEPEFYYYKEINIMSEEFLEFKVNEDMTLHIEGTSRSTGRSSRGWWC